jgi:glutamyl-Q tRNA(Asp) synthetase
MDREPVITRFAPSPTGPLHLGHAYSAVRAHAFARERGGAFLLRIEDIDGTRSRAEHVDGILADLVWLGLEWDEPVVFQSPRLDRYAAALDVLKGRGLVYPCFCTRAEIAEAMSAPHGPAAVYPGTCRGVDSAARMGEAHAWRLDMAAAVAAAGPLDWWDERAGTVRAEPERQGDVVLARKDVATSYHLAVTVDDAAQGVTDVVRGVDLFEVTHVHRLLQALLGLPSPRYHHHPLLAGSDGERLAKRRGSASLASLRADGVDGRKLAAGLMEDTPPAGFSVARD